MADTFEPAVKHFDSEAALARAVTDEVANLIRERHAAGGAVLVLPTGATPLPIYRELIRQQREEGLDFSRVKAFNLDEYLGLGPKHPHSFHRYLWNHLLGPLVQSPERGLRREHVQLLRGDVSRAKATEVCHGHEQSLRQAGGMDLVLLGIGANGHIAFNEPGSPADSRTRRVRLDESTRQDAAPTFGSLEEVPEEALTMGVGTLLEARRILLVASGAKKQDVIRRALAGPITETLPASLLRRHPRVTFYLQGVQSSETP